MRKQIIYQRLQRFSSQGFQQNHSNLTQSKQQNYQYFLQKNINQYDQQYIQQLVQQVSDLSVSEYEYLIKKYYEKQNQLEDYIPISLYHKKIELTKTDDYSEEWFKNQKDLQKIFPGSFEEFKYYFEGNHNKVGGSVLQQTQSAPVHSEKTEEKIEEKQEQIAFNLELTEIDASSKIKIIKEVRTLFGLGLKEAKDAVEKLPCTLKAGIKKEEAQKLKETLEKVGCKINIV